jgi:peroxidase
MKTKTTLLSRSFNILRGRGVVAGLTLALLPVVSYAEDRSYDGTGNNLAHPEWGAPAPYDRLAPNAYEDGIAAPARSGNQSARAVTNIVMSQTVSVSSKQNLSDLWQAFGTVLAVDFAFGASNPADPFFIAVPPGDAVFSAFPALPFFRGIFVSAPAREQINVITPWADVASFYGQSEADAKLLRSLDFNGVSPGELIALRLGNGEEVSPTIGLIKLIKGIDPSSNPASPVLNLPAPDLLAAQDFLFTTGIGFSGPNTSPNSSMVLTLLVREHNRVARTVNAFTTAKKTSLGLPDRASNPAAYDERLYQLARKVLIAEVEAIFYDEFLPAIGAQVADYKGYNPSLQPDVYTEFAASLAVGHSAVRHEVAALNEAGQVLFAAPLKSTVFNPGPFLALGADGFIRGALANRMEEIDSYVVDDIRNVAVGFANDIVAETIQRGRDRGVPDFNTIRLAMGLPPYSSFQDLTGDITAANNLQLAYPGGIATLDPSVGFMVEKHQGQRGMGQTSIALWQEQFALWRDGDRFWYQNEINNDQQFATALQYLGFTLESGHFKVLNRNIASLILDNTAIGQGGFGLNRKTNAFFVGQH